MANTEPRECENPLYPRMGMSQMRGHYGIDRRLWVAGLAQRRVQLRQSHSSTMLLGLTDVY